MYNFHKMWTLGRKITALLASTRFFWVVFGFFVFEALWIAFSAVFPMPFDEDFHFGVIRFFSEQGSPFMADQPTTADSFGAVIRDPSFLYHYVLAVPYRFLHIFTENQAVIILLLRLMNIALFAWGLVLFRKVLLRATNSSALTHTALGIFILIPIVPQLAAHISYDNLLFLMVAWLCLLVIRFLDDLQRRRLNVSVLGALLLLCMASSLVKYESLPLVVGTVLFVGCMIWSTFRKQSFKKVMVAGWRRLNRLQVVSIIGLFILLAVLIGQRYGGNVWTYQALKPDCAAVLDESRCASFGPWARNHDLAEKKGEVDANPFSYTEAWLKGLHLRLFFAISGLTNNYVSYSPLPVPAVTAIVVAVSALVVLIVYSRRIFAHNPLLVFFLLLSMLYLGALWVQTYTQFLQTGMVVAVNGRYLIPILLLLAAIIGTGLRIVLRPFVKPFVAAAVLLFFMHGGGMFTFILRSDQNWYWQNAFVISANERARTVISPFIIEGNKY